MNIAIIWASNNKEKFWNKILLNLKQRGFNIFPINPKEKTIEWYKCYKKLSEIKENLNIVVFVVKPNITKDIISNNKWILKKTKIWLQPWSYNNEILKLLEVNNQTDKYVYGFCIMKNKI